MRRLFAAVTATHHRIAVAVITAALILDAACGLAYAAAEHLAVPHGLYCALLNAVTVGGDVSPTNVAGYLINAVEALTVVPLFAATFSLFTSGLTAVHVQRAEHRIKRHITAAMPGPAGPDPER